MFWMCAMTLRLAGRMALHRALACPVGSEWYTAPVWLALRFCDGIF